MPEHKKSLIPKRQIVSIQEHPNYKNSRKICPFPYGIAIFRRRQETPYPCKACGTPHVLPERRLPQSSQRRQS